MLLGNKFDKIGERKVSVYKIQQYCQNNKIAVFIETSAKDNTKVDKAFEEGAKLALKRHEEEIDNLFIPNGFEIKLINNQSTQKKNAVK